MDRLPAFEDVARILEESESRDVLVAGQYAGKVGKYHGKWYVAGPRMLRELKLGLALAMGVEAFNRGERNHLKHYYECDTVEDAVRTYEGLLAYEE